MIAPPDTGTRHLIRAFEIVAIGRFFKPSLLADTLTRPLTFRIGTKALPVACSGVRGIQLTTMQAFTTSSLFHDPMNLRKKRTGSKRKPTIKTEVGQRRRRKDLKGRF